MHFGALQRVQVDTSALAEAAPVMGSGVPCPNIAALQNKKILMLTSSFNNQHSNHTGNNPSPPKNRQRKYYLSQSSEIIISPWDASGINGCAEKGTRKKPCWRLLFSAGVARVHRHAHRLYDIEPTQSSQDLSLRNKQKPSSISTDAEHSFGCRAWVAGGLRHSRTCRNF